MKISELIDELKRVRDEYGDVRVVTPGFDEAGLDDVMTVEPVAIAVNGGPGGHAGLHRQMAFNDAADPTWDEVAVKVNF